MIDYIKTVAIYVEDQQNALEFYTDKLGFEVRRDQPMGPTARWIELAPPGADTGVVIYPRSLMPSWKELKPSIMFHCADVAATCEELAASGVTVPEQPREMPWGTYAKFSDLDGNEFLLVTPKGP